MPLLHELSEPLEFLLLFCCGGLAGLVRTYWSHSRGHRASVHSFCAHALMSATATCIIPLFGGLLVDLGNSIKDKEVASLVGLSLLVGLFAREFINKVARTTIEPDEGIEDYAQITDDAQRAAERAFVFTEFYENFVKIGNEERKRGNINAAKKLFAAALDGLERVITLDERDCDAHALAAYCARGVEDIPLAIKYIESAIALQTRPKLEHLINHSSYLSLADYSRTSVVRVLERALKLYPSRDSRMWMKQCLLDDKSYAIILDSKEFKNFLRKLN